MKRRTFSPAQKAKVIERQRGLCACACGEVLIVGHIDYDHEMPLSMGGADTLENLRALIRKHHLAKTSKEATVRAKCDRQRAKFLGTKLSAGDRETARILQRKQQAESI